MIDRPKPSLGALLDAAFAAGLVDVHTHLPARVESYDAATQKCSVQVELRQARFEPDGSRVPEVLSPILDVPVLFSSGGGFRTTYPLQRGDKVWLEICEASLELWKTRGGDVDPGDDRRMDLSDAVAVTGLRDFAHPLKSAPTDRMSVGHDTGASIEITSSEVRVGGNTGVHPTYKADAFQSALMTLLSAISAAIGGSGTPAGAAAAQAALELPGTGAFAVFEQAITAAQTAIAKVK